MLLQTCIQLSQIQEEMMYGCQKCGELLSSDALLKRHMKIIHTEPKNAVCKLCPRAYKTIKSLKRHEKIHSEEKVEKKQKSGEFQCAQCQKKYNTQTALFWHFERHHSENKNSNLCQVCGKQLVDTASLKRHLEMMHSLESVKCHVCNKTFKSHMNLQRHINITHAPREAAQKCNICGKTFKCSMHLRIHVRTVHPTDNYFSCDICNKSFPSKKYMYKHRKSHVDVKEHPCEICEKLFKTNDDVRKHIKRVHMKPEKTENTAPKNTERKKPPGRPKSLFTPQGPFKCDVCDKEFSRKKYMILHKRTHVDAKLYSCGECSKSFKCLTHVRKHTKRVHRHIKSGHAESPNSTESINCDICDKPFSCKKYMLSHRKIHVNAKDFPCKECGKLFRTLGEANKHLKRVHMKSGQSGVTETPSSTEKSSETAECVDNANIIEDDTLDFPGSIDFGDEVLGSTDFTLKALDSNEFTMDPLEATDFTLEDLGSTEFNVALDDTNYTLETLGTTEFTDTLKNTDYIVSKELEEALGSTEVMEKALGNTEDIQEAVENTEDIHVALDNTGDIQEAIENTDDLEKAIGTRDIEKALESTEYIEQALANTEDMEKELENIEYTVEALGTLSADYMEDVLGTELEEALKCTEYSDETLGNIQFLEETLASSIELLNCLKCGRDFENDAELHSHILNCGDDVVTSFVDFRDM